MSICPCCKRKLIKQEIYHQPTLFNPTYKEIIEECTGCGIKGGVSFKTPYSFLNISTLRIIRKIEEGI